MEPINAIIDYGDPYVQPLILSALQKLIPANKYVLRDSLQECPPDSRTLQIRSYESIDFTRALQNPQDLINAYVIRKALIRKHYLSSTVSTWVTKHPDSVLKDHVKPSVEFELDYAEFLDDALLEAYELRESFAKNEGKEGAEKEWWILKPGMSDRGQGIRLFSTEEDLQAIFEEWEVDSEDEDEDEGSEGKGDDDAKGVMTSHLRHFVAQPYIDPPLLLSPPGASDATPRKFHIRTYVLAYGALQVFVYKPMLALFAAQPYAPPWEATSEDDLRAHLTNTCLQGSDQREGSVNAFWSLPSSVRGPDGGDDENWKDAVWEQICAVTGELFEAASRGMMVHFQALPNAFEVFGLDFMVDDRMRVWLLEVNAFPDFAQTGADLKELVEGLWEDVIHVAAKAHFGLDGGAVDGTDRMKKVLGIDLGRR